MKAPRYAGSGHNIQPQAISAFPLRQVIHGLVFGLAHAPSPHTIITQSGLKSSNGKPRNACGSCEHTKTTTPVGPHPLCVHSAPRCGGQLPHGMWYMQAHTHTNPVLDAAQADHCARHQQTNKTLGSFNMLQICSRAVQSTLPYLHYVAQKLSPAAAASNPHAPFERTVCAPCCAPPPAANITAAWLLQVLLCAALAKANSTQRSQSQPLLPSSC